MEKEPSKLGNEEHLPTPTKLAAIDALKTDIPFSRKIATALKSIDFLPALAELG